MAEQKHVYLHIGYNKTGTTTIQRALFGAADTLRENGVIYPTFSSNHFQLTFTLSDPPNEFSAAQQRVGVDSAPAWKRKQKYIETHLREMRGSPGESLVLSSESFCALSIPRIEALRELVLTLGHDHTVIVYIRDPVSWMTSRFLQSMRGGVTIEEASGNFRGGIDRYMERIERFQSVFGQDRVDIRLFEVATRSEGGLVGDFLRAIRAPTHLASQLAADHVNAGSNNEQVLIYDAINKERPTMIDGKINRRRDFRIVSRLAKIGATKLDLYPAIAEACGDDLRKLYSWLHAKVPSTRGVFSLDDRRHNNAVSYDDPEALRAAFEQICVAFNDLGAQSTKASADKSYWKARFHLERGEIEQALETCESALNLDPEHGGVREVLRKVRSHRNAGEMAARFN